MTNTTRLMLPMKITVDYSGNNRKYINTLVKNVDFVNVKACGTYFAVRYFL
jgi:hypothetical protein